MKKTAKLLVLLLSVALIIGALVMVVGAENDNAFGYYDESGNLQSCATFAEAFANSPDGEVFLLKDVTITESIVIEDTASVDLGDFTITNTSSAPVFTIQAGTVDIYGGASTINTSGVTVFDIASDASLYVENVTVNAKLATGGVTEFTPEMAVTGEGSFEAGEGYEVNLDWLFTVTNGSTTTYYATEAEFRACLSNPANGDNIKLNNDITLTAEVSAKSGDVTTNFNLDINGNTLDAAGFKLINLGTRSAKNTVTITSSVEGGVINSVKHRKESGTEALSGDAVITVSAGDKDVTIKGAVDGKTTLTVNAASLYYANGVGSTSCGTSQFYIEGGFYNQIGASNNGFICSHSIVYNSILRESGTDFNFKDATFVQAYFYKGYVPSLHADLDTLDGDSVKGGVPQLFYLSTDKSWTGYGADNATAGVTYFDLTNCDIIGRTPTASVFMSELWSGEIRYKNCRVSADIAPRQNSEFYITADSSYPYYAGGRAIIGTGTTYSHCSTEIKEYTEEVITYTYDKSATETGLTKQVVTPGTFLAEGTKMFATSLRPESFDLPNVPSAAERDGAVAIYRDYLANANAGLGSNYGTVYKNAGNYFIVKNGTDIESFITSEDMAEAFIGETAVKSPAKKLLAIELGKQNYYTISNEDYEKLDILFSITHQDGTESIYTSLDEWKQVMECYVSTPSKVSTDGLTGATDVNGDGKIDLNDYDGRYNRILLDGDTIVLHGDITYTGDIRAQFGVFRNITLDLNGHTIDASASSKPFLTMGSAGAGQENGNHNNVIQFSLKSSAPNGKIVKTGRIFDILGENKQLTIVGKNVTIEAQSLIYYSGIASGAGKNTEINVDGGNYVQLAGGTNYTFIDVRVNSNSPYQLAGALNFKNASFVSKSESEWFLRQRHAALGADKDGTPHTYSMSTLRSTLAIENCDITLESDKIQFVSAGTYEHIITLKDTEITAPGGFGIVTYGKILIDEGTVLNVPKKINPKTYDAAAIADCTGANAAVYYAAEGIVLAKTPGASTYTATKADVENVKYVVNDKTLVNEWYLAGTDTSADAPVVTLINNTLTSQSYTWGSAVDGKVITYTALIENDYKLPAYVDINASLYTQIAINIYLPEDYAILNTNAGLEFVASDVEGIYVATVRIDSNEAFKLIASGLSFEQDDVVMELSFAKELTLYSFLEKAMEEYTGAELDVAYYIASYLKAAYNYMDLDASETDAIAALGFASSDEAFDAVIGDYVPTAEYAPVYEEYAGATLGVGISVDLKSTPEFVFVLSGDAKSVAVNGVALETEQRSIGGQDVLVSVYANANVHNFDKNITVTTYDENGAEIATAVVCFANYAFNANESGDATVMAVVDALYKYILAAEALPASAE